MKTLVIRPGRATIGQGFQMNMSMKMKRMLVQGLAMMAVALVPFLFCGCAHTGAALSPSDIERFRTEAHRGDARAQYRLGLAYRDGEGVSTNDTLAAEWFRKAAEQGNAEAQCCLGTAYDSGKGVPQEYAEALKWYRKAAEQGDSTGMTLLGRAYFKGRGYVLTFEHRYFMGNGVQQDDVEAYKWLSLAAQKGSKDAAKALGELTAKMPPEQIAEGKKRAAAFVPKKTSP